VSDPCHDAACSDRPILAAGARLAEPPDPWLDAVPGAAPWRCMGRV